MSGVLGDFDGDSRPDLAVARPRGVVNGAYRYRIDVLFAGQQGSGFDLESGPPGGLHLSVRDVDGDRDLDLVLTSEFGREPVGVWINDGHGQFTKSTAESYGNSIWHDTDRDFEAPDRTNLRDQSLAVSGGGWSRKPASSPLPPLSGRKATLYVAAAGRALAPLNTGHPFRAPPVS